MFSELVVIPGEIVCVGESSWHLWPPQDVLSTLEVHLPTPVSTLIRNYHADLLHMKRYQVPTMSKSLIYLNGDLVLEHLCMLPRHTLVQHTQLSNDTWRRIGAVLADSHAEFRRNMAVGDMNIKPWLCWKIGDSLPFDFMQFGAPFCLVTHENIPLLQLRSTLIQTASRLSDVFVLEPALQPPNQK